MTGRPFRFFIAFIVPRGLSETMSDGETVEEIERHNVRMARRIVEYWRRQGVEISVASDPTKNLRSVLGPGGLPRGYRGGDGISVTAR